MEQTETQNSLTLYFDKHRVEGETKNTLLQSFETFFNQAQEWKEKAQSLVITSIDQKEEIAQATEAHKLVKNLVSGVEIKRVELKEESLRKGQTIDAIAKIITNELLPIRDHLEKQRKFVEIQEAKRIAELKESRETDLAKFDVQGQFYDLGNMPEETYAQLLENSRIAHEAKIQAALVAEAERIANEKAEEEKRLALIAEEKERQRLRDIENERLKKEAEAREKELAKERAENEKKAKAAELLRQKEQDKADAILKAEREAREKLQRELEVKQLEEERIRLAKIAEQEEKEAKAKALLLAPDKEKVKVFFEQFKQLEFPQLESEAGKKMTIRINEALAVVKQVIIQDSKTLNQ